MNEKHVGQYFTCCGSGEIILMTRRGINITSTCNGLKLLEAMQFKHACSGCIFSSPWKCLIDLNMTDALWAISSWVEAWLLAGVANFSFIFWNSRLHIFGTCQGSWHACFLSVLAKSNRWETFGERFLVAAWAWVWWRASHPAYLWGTRTWKINICQNCSD